MKNLLIGLLLVFFATASNAFADGREDYKYKCAGCHGANVSLLPKTARLMQVDPKKLALKGSTMNRDEMIAIVQTGKDKMPGFEKELTKEQIAGIIDYIIFLRKK